MDTDNALLVRANNDGATFTVEHIHELGRDRLILDAADARLLVDLLTAALDASMAGRRQ